MSLATQESHRIIDSFIQEVAASEKRASTLSEPGSIGGETTHPIKNVDDRLKPVKEGERSAENEKDVKEDQGKPGVNSTPEPKAGSDGAVMTPGSAHDDHLNIGLTVQPTGEDSANETEKAKAGKEDPGSTHPARTDNDELDGHKYSSDRLRLMDYQQLAKTAADLGNGICAALAMQQPPQQPAQQKQAAAQQPQRTAQAPPVIAHQAGWELAGLASGQFDKAAADRMVTESLTEMVKVAVDDADDVARYLMAYEKRSNELEAGGPPPTEGGDPAALMGMGGGGGMPPGGGGMPPGGGEDEMMAALGGGQPPAGGPPGGGPGGPGGPGGEEAAIAQLESLMQELGITPEELIEALSSEEGGGPGGPGGPGGGAGPTDGPPPGGAPAAGPPGGGMETEAFDRFGRRVKKSHNQTEIVDYVRELITRSRRP
jgi:hypothetical protein